MKRNKNLITLSAVLLVIAGNPVLAPGAWAASKYKTLYALKGGTNSITGRSPIAGLIFDGAGNLYGTTEFGGVNGSGNVFELTPNADGHWTQSILYSFCSTTKCSDGAGPTAGLIFDAGNLYGTTQQGGAYGGGTVFKLASNSDGSWTESVLYSFCSATNCSDGLEPAAGLIFDQAGNLYGTTFYGGVGGTAGTVFELTSQPGGSWTESVLYRFCSLKNCSDGSEPFAGLIFDGAGNLYGTTVYGGPGGTSGVVFKLTHQPDGSWTESVLHSFCSLTKCGDGAQPFAGLILDQAGNLYGTTAAGGNFTTCGRFCGVAFQLIPRADGSWKEKVLHRFTGRRDGGQPVAGLIRDQAGNLYGTTKEGGNLSGCGGMGCGVVFKLSPSSNGGWKSTALYRFADHPGALPWAALIFDTSGNLYGTTSGDGSKTFGSVFEITP